MECGMLRASLGMTKMTFPRILITPLLLLMRIKCKGELRRKVDLLIIFNASFEVRLMRLIN